MSDMQNTLKEVDIQVVYRRLEARKRNITRDGQMSKRQLATAYRGYHGLESQYHALLEMSNASLVNTKIKNDHLQSRHVEEMKQLIEQEKIAKDKTEKELKFMRDDFTAQLAYQYVYKNQSFKRYYKSQQQKKPRPVSDKPELYDMEKRNSAKGNGLRPLGSLRQMELYKDELKLKFPPIANSGNGNEINSPRVNMMGEKTYTELKLENNDNKPQDLTSFPNIEDAMGIQVKFRYKPKDEDRLSALTAPPAGLEAESEDQASDVNPNLISFNMGQNLILMRQKEKEKVEKRRVLPATPKVKPGKTAEVIKDTWRRILPQTPNRPSTVYHGKRNDVEMRKMMKKEATDVIALWSNKSIRKDVVEFAKEHHKALLAENPVPTFDRSRPTSAILRDYKEYKRHKEEEIAMREQEEDNQTIIVRQMSPQPRVGSPVATTRNKYMYAARPGTAKEGSKSHARQLHRTDSEKFPSVSRTSSYKEVPGTELHENALLTAAERIELEKEKRSKENPAEVENKAETTQNIKRLLPITPSVATKKINRPNESKLNITGPVKMFNTAVLSHDRDSDMINRVKLANLTHEEGVRFPDNNLLERKNNEVNPYTPTGKQQNNSTIGGGISVSTTESFMRIKSASAMYGKDLWPKLSKKMHFDYESYSRTTPEMKKRLETRAKNRRKIQQKNAQLAAEIKAKPLAKQNGKETGSRMDSERPPTRVSFNENVIVFQTI